MMGRAKNILTPSNGGFLNSSISDDDFSANSRFSEFSGVK
jgi:hypothetical protein